MQWVRRKPWLDQELVEGDNAIWFNKETAVRGSFIESRKLNLLGRAADFHGHDRHLLLTCSNGWNFAADTNIAKLRTIVLRLGTTVMIGGGWCLHAVGANTRRVQQHGNQDK